VPITKPTHGQTGNWDDATNAAIDWINANETVSTRVGTLETSNTTLSETIDDRVAALLQQGANVTLSYNDASNTLTISASMDIEAIDDRVAALLQQGAGITIAYDDTAGTLTISSLLGGTAGGVLSGTYPNPGFAVDMATQAELDAVAALKANLASPTFTGTQTLPRPVSTPVAVTFATPLTINASTGVRFKTTATTDFTLNAPSNPVDGQQITLVVLASGATRTVTINAAILLTTGLSASVAIASGKKWIAGLIYDGDAAAWVLVASTQTA
jgi:ribulose bisphosphate carboxylase small subunit